MCMRFNQIKKKLLITVIIVVSIILLFPTRNQLKDGGTVEYQSLVYKISKVKRLIPEEQAREEGKVKNYDRGIIIEILGFEIFNNVK